MNIFYCVVYRLGRKSRLVRKLARSLGLNVHWGVHAWLMDIQTDDKFDPRVYDTPLTRKKLEDFFDTIDRSRK